jgi:geranylgeranyl pyrophosphate synthase
MTAKKIQAVSNENSLQSYLNETEATLNNQLQTLMPAIRELKLHKQIEYVLQTRGKRLRSAMVLLSGECLSAKKEDLLKLSLAVELLHSASLVHDDILDREVFRRNAISVQARWSVKEAILVGDALASLALGLCRDYKNEVLDVMAAACLQLSDGEYMDVSLSSSALCERDYLEKAKKKTGALFKAAAECGALAANGKQNEVDALAAFGMNFGVAFQIKDDIADVVALENTVPADFNELRATLPIVHLYETSGKDNQMLLAKFGSARKSLDQKVLLQGLRAELERADCVSYCSDKIDAYMNDAVACLSSVRESRFKTCLVEMVEQLKFT